MRRTGLRARIMVGGVVTAVVAGTATAAVAFARPDTLPLRPLAAAQPALDAYQRVLVRVPAGTPVVATSAAGNAAGNAATADVPSGGDSPTGSDSPTGDGSPSGVDLAALARYEGRVDRLERGDNGRVLAILTDGNSVDVTAGGGSSAPLTAPAGTAPSTTAPSSTAPSSPVAKGVPAPLSALAADPGVVDISPVDATFPATATATATATTWRITGKLPAERVAELTGLPTQNDILMQLTADDTYRSLLWALENNGGNIGGYLAVPDADVDGVEANRRSTGTGVVVAVVDSGIQASHPDLPALWHNPDEICGNGIDDDQNGYVDDCDGWDFVHNDNTPYDAGDDNDHGTHVAGTIAAVPNNGKGVAGLAPGATLMSVKVTANGSMWMSDVAKAIRYAADNGAKIVNASLGTSPGAPREAVREVENAIAYAGSKGVLVVAAAGNDGVNTDATPVWPADLPLANIVSVGASTASERAASFSNYGATSVDLFAPGHYIASTVDKGGYAAMQGTSMAAPHVAAAAALVLAADPALPPAELRQRLMDTVDVVDAYRGRSITGGRLNAERALAASGVTLEASAFHNFSADTPHTGNVTVKAAPGTVPAGVAVTPQATLLTLVDGTTYGVVDQPVTVDGKDLATDAGAQVPLGPADGVDGTDPALTAGGIRVAVGMTLPAGQYALVVDLVSVVDPDYAYGRSNAVFFVVPGPDEAVPAPADPAPGDGSSPSPGGYVPPAGNGQPPVMTNPQPAPTTPGQSPGPGTAPGTGTTPNPWSPGPWTGPGTGTPPTSGGVPAPGSTPGSGTTPPGTVPGPGTGPGAVPAPAPAPGTVPGSGGAPAPRPRPTIAPRPGATITPPTVPPAPEPSGGAPSTGTGPAPTSPPAPVTENGITITSLTPGNGPAGGGTAIMIMGTGFPAYPVVQFGGAGAYVQSSNSYLLTVIAPAGAAGSAVSVTVGDRNGRSVTMPAAFRYDAGPTSGGTTPGATPPGTAGPGSPGSGTPGPGSGAPGPGSGAPAPGATPSNPGTAPSSPGTAPSGPPGATRRNVVRLGQVTPKGGLRLAPAIGFHLSPSMWTTSRCGTVLCRGVAI